MRIFFTLLFCVSLVLNAYAFNNTITVDFRSPHSFRILLSELKIGDIPLDGEAFVSVTKSQGYYIYNLDIRDLALGDLVLSAIEAKVVKKNEQLIINYAKSKDFLIRGKIDYVKNAIDLNVTVHMTMDTEDFRGQVKGEVMVSGTFDHPALRGSIFVKDGKLVDLVFKESSLFFNGYYPYLSINNSEVVLTEGTTYLLDGVVNAGDFKSLYAGLRSSAKELLSLGQWRLYNGAGDRGIGRDVDSRLGVRMGSATSGKPTQEQLGTELRFRLNGDQFLKYRVQEDKSILGFERKREF